VASGETPLGGFMINRSPTWQMWKLIHTFSLDYFYEALTRVLHSPHRVNSRTPLNNAWTWIAINFFMNIVACSSLFEVSFLNVISFFSIGSFVIPIITMLIALGFSLRVTQMISRQREVGNFDLFAVLPEGELAAALFITRAYRHPLEGEVRGFKWVVILTVISIGVALFRLVSGISAIAVFPAWFLAGGMELFVGYIQSLVAAAALSLLLSQRRNPSVAQGGLVGSFFLLQLVFYIASGAVLNAVALNMFAAANQGDTLPIYLWVVVIQPILLISVREFINFLLWQAVKRQLDT
jgi:hypothetical protein